MRHAARTLVVFLLALLLAAPASMAQTPTIQERVNDLVKKHYMDGVQYSDAKALGREAVPYLVSLLGDPQEKQFWVNIIVTLGFIEDSSALVPLQSFLEGSTGEVDAFTFRALLSVPFAIGCIASNGDPDAYAYLLGRARGGPAAARARWRFGNQNIDHLLTEQGVVGLSVSGLPAAKAELQRMKAESQRTSAPGSEAPSLADALDDGLKTMDRMSAKGKAAVFNPTR